MRRADLSEADKALLKQADVLRRDITRTEARMRRKEREKRAAALKESAAPNRRQPRERDDGYLSWLHEGLPCIACLIEGAPSRPGPIEAAHQKLNLANKGWKKVSGTRVHDRQCAPLCHWHHQDAPNACDKAQRHFWDRLAIGDLIADLCADLYAAFKGGQPGAPVVLRYAHAAMAELTAARDAGLQQVKP